MNPAIIALCVVGLFLAYGIVAGLVAGVCTRTGIVSEDNAINVGLFWPLALPFLAIIIPGAILHAWVGGKLK